MTDDLRSYINLIESKQTTQLDEAGGPIDKMLSKLSKVPGLGDIGGAAEGRIEAKEFYKNLRKAWVKFAATQPELDKRSSEDIKQFLRDVGLTDEYVEKVEGLNDTYVLNLGTVFKSATKIMIKLSGPDVSAKGMKGMKGAAGGSAGSDIEDIIDYFKSDLRGDVGKLTREARTRPSSDNPLALLGYATLRSHGAI